MATVVTYKVAVPVAMAKVLIRMAPSNTEVTTVPVLTMDRLVVSLIMSTVEPTVMEDVSDIPVMEGNPELVMHAVTVVTPLIGSVGSNVGDAVGASEGEALG